MPTRRLLAATGAAVLALAVAPATNSAASAPAPALAPAPAPAAAAPAAAPVATTDMARAFTHVPGVGPARRAANGLLEVRLPDGSVHTTHGADAPHSHPGETIAPTPAEATPACSTTQRTFVFYASPKDKTYRYDTTMISRLRTITRQVTGEIRSEGLLSSNNTKGPLLKVACNSDGTIRVGGIKLATTVSTADSFASIVGDMKAAGWTDPNTKYLVFYDDPVTGACGAGDLEQDDRKVTDNASNVGASYAVVYGNPTGVVCWDWFTATHELFHNMGAVQQNAPYASGPVETRDGKVVGGHCNDGYDVMCYADGGSKSAYSTSYCSKTRLDCRFDTYYDTVTESGEWLATHWNIGWSGNYYLRF